jgi:thioredoxin-dependent peroxiredoxin
VAFFAASVDPPETSRKFAESLGLDYPLLSDPAKRVAQAYGVVGPDQPFASRWTFYVGLDGTIAHIDKQISASNIGEAIVARLAELGVRRRARSQ